MDSSTQIKLTKTIDEIKNNLTFIVKNPEKIKNLQDEDLINLCIIASQSYRSGHPLIGDDFYDHFLIKELTKRDPNHPLVNEVEDDYQSFGSQKITLPEKMLSTQKAYEMKQIELFLERIYKKAIQLGISLQNLQFKVMAKLDGFAAYYDGNQLITRGNGTKGTDISRALRRGLIIYQKQHSNLKAIGAGEIVVEKSYFYRYLVNDFIHPRNFVASVIKEKKLDEKTKKAIKTKKALFVPFSQLDAIYLRADELITKLDEVNQTLTSRIDFEFDGLVIELSDVDEAHKELREQLGSTLHHHRWQIAYKKNTLSAKSIIIEVTPQIGRTGKITPVALIFPVKLSGATISRVSVHNYALVEKLEIGKNAKIEIVRSGEVIPKITAILKPAEKVVLPKKCPSCESALIWQTQFLICPNHQHCPEQIKGSLCYFFVSLDNLDGFGPATIKTFYDYGIRKVSEIYQLTENALIKMSYQKKTRNNLLRELSQSKNQPLEDWRFLSAFGIERLGTAASMKLLKKFKLHKLFELKENQISEIDGFAKITAQAILKGLKEKEKEIRDLLPQFNLINTKNLETQEHLVLMNQKICFTGKMKSNREVMQSEARRLGAVVMSSISSTTDLLVAGEKAGKAKLEKAYKLNIKTISEDEYLNLIKQQSSA